MIVVNNTKNRIPIDINRSGVSYVVRNELAILPAVPKVVITENPIGPQLQAPADAPIIVPVILVPIFLIFFTILTLKIFIETTMPANIDKISISSSSENISTKLEEDYIKVEDENRPDLKGAENVEHTGYQYTVGLSYKLLFSKHCSQSKHEFFSFLF